MSWQAYVDNNLLGTGKVTQAAILGLKGGVWASSAGFSLSNEEQATAVKAFNNLDQTLQSGVKLAGQKYFVLQADERRIVSKKAADGAILVKTTQAILVAVYAAPLQAPETSMVVEGLADYLISVGY